MYFCHTMKKHVKQLYAGVWTIFFLPALCWRYFFSVQIEWSLQIFSRIPKCLSYQHALFYGNRPAKQIFRCSRMNLFVSKVNLQPQFTVNLLLVACIVTFNVFYLVVLNLVWVTPYFIDFLYFLGLDKISWRINFFGKDIL